MPGDTALDALVGPAEEPARVLVNQPELLPTELAGLLLDVILLADAATPEAAFTLANPGPA